MINSKEKKYTRSYLKKSRILVGEDRWRWEKYFNEKCVDEDAQGFLLGLRKYNELHNSDENNFKT